MNELLKNRFSGIFHGNTWGSIESRSGKGSEVRNTEKIIKEIPKLIKKYKIKSILDIPCGDFNYMKEIELDCDYIGADIVPSLIEENKSNYKNVKFECLDITSDELPKCDLVLVRDCLVHLSNENILKAIDNIKKSGSKYLLTTSFERCIINVDLGSRMWRAINVKASPFNMDVIDSIRDDTELIPATSDKKLYLIKL